MLTIRKPYLLFLGDVGSEIFAKTAHGLKDWCPEDCVAQWRLPEASVDLGLPELAPEAAFAAGARSLVIGVAPIGGALPLHWIPAILKAIDAGLDIVSGMHGMLAAVPAIATAAERKCVALHDVRNPPAGIPIGTGRRRGGRRLLTVGTDCSLGKKYTALAIAQNDTNASIAAAHPALAVARPGCSYSQPAAIAATPPTSVCTPPSSPWAPA
jgi:uncharacterized NAD-dependent epimerase/dehydratase family protein